MRCAAAVRQQMCGDQGNLACHLGCSCEKINKKYYNLKKWCCQAAQEDAFVFAAAIFPRQTILPLLVRWPSKISIYSSLSFLFLRFQSLAGRPTRRLTDQFAAAADIFSFLFFEPCTHNFALSETQAFSSSSQ